MSNKKIIDAYKTNHKKVFFEDEPFAHMYVKDEDNKLVRLVETQPLQYLGTIVENIEQTKEAVQILTNLTHTLLEEAKEAMAIGDAESFQKINTNVATILNYKGEIGKLTKSAPADIDGIKLLINRLLKDAQEENMALVGDRPMGYRENPLDLTLDDMPEVIHMEDE